MRVFSGNRLNSSSNYLGPRSEREISGRSHEGGAASRGKLGRIGVLLSGFLTRGKNGESYANRFVRGSAQGFLVPTPTRSHSLLIEDAGGAFNSRRSVVWGGNPTIVPKPRHSCCDRWDKDSGWPSGNWPDRVSPPPESASQLALDSGGDCRDAMDSDSILGQFGRICDRRDPELGSDPSPGDSPIFGRSRTTRSIQGRANPGSRRRPKTRRPRGGREDGGSPQEVGG